MFVVAGSTGHTGRVVAESLLEQGRKVRVVVRDEKKGEPFARRGAQVAVADLTDAAALTRALEGAEAAYLLAPPDVTSSDYLGSRKALVKAQAQAVADARLPRLVYLSSIGAQHASGTGPIRALHHAEEVLGMLDTRVSFVRASYFLENWGAILSAAQKDGVAPSFVPIEQAFAQVSSQDVGRVAAELMVDAKAPRVVELEGPRALSAVDIAEALSSLLGRPVKAVDAPLEAVVPTFTSFGLSENLSQLYREMYEGVANGRIAFEGKGTVHRRGVIEAQTALKALLGG